MKNLTQLLDTIRNCSACYGTGMTGWVSPDGDYDFEYCDCNPQSLIVDFDGEVIG